MRIRYERVTSIGATTNMRLRLPLALIAAVALLTGRAEAVVYYWDPTGTTATATPTGTWDTTSAFWSTSSALSAAPVTWQDNVAACFCAGTAATGTFTVQLDTTINCAGIFNGALTPPGCFVTIAGSGALNMAVDSAMHTSGANGGTTTVAVPMIGTGNIVLEGTKSAYLHGTNTYSGGTKLGYNSGGTVISFTGTVYFNNDSAFGTGPMQMFASSQNYTLVAEGTNPITISNPFTPVVGTNINFTGNTGGLTLAGNWTLGAATPGIGINANPVTISGIMAGTGGLNKFGAAALKLTGANTYTGVTTISNGSLTIGATGSIGSSSRIKIYPGANGSVLDVSANNVWTLGSATTLVAGGTGTATSTAAMIKGASPAGVIGFGTRPIILNFTPTTFTGDTTHPPLYITQGSLTLNNNSFTVTNAAATPLGRGTYRLVQVASATINGSPNPIVSVVGTGLAANTSATLAVAGGQINLVVKSVPAFTNIVVAQTTAVGRGVQTITISGRLSAAGPVYPALNETINVNLNGAIVAAPVTNSTGDFAATFNVSSIPYLPTNYPVTYSYTGNASMAGVTNNSTKILANSFLQSSALAGFFGGYNMITTNDSGLNMFAWSSTNPCLPVTDWNLEGAMAEQPLGDEPGKSRYTWSGNPTDPNVTVYYIFGTTLTWPYGSPTAAQWIAVDASSTQTYYNTNVSISAAGILSIPSGPVIVQQTTNLTVIAGKNVNFNAVATGSPTLSYQWYLNGSTLINGAVNSALQFANVSANQMGSYSVIVSNQYGTATSAPASLTVLPPPQISTQVSGDSLQVNATGVAGDPYLLQTTASLTTPITWTTIVTNTADANGLVQFTNGMTGGTNQFYRILCP